MDIISPGTDRNTLRLSAYKELPLIILPFLKEEIANYPGIIR